MTAVFLRLWNLEQLPPGLYRDEAYNGLDALKVLDGDLRLIFPANNGREPLYIYLTALFVALFGQTIFAVRVGAALVGGLTTIPVYLLGSSWFGRTVGLLAAWIWVITLWPVHLSRLGLRPILFVPLIAVAFWLGTLAYRRGQAWLWAAAGLVYGLTFYTYLVSRFTPLLLLALGVYLLATGRARRLWPGGPWFALGALLALLPLLVLFSRDPALVLGRTGQVSVLHPDVHQGDLAGTLWRQVWSALGMFIWRGDTILRHNPAGRPVFDLIMAVPFLLGLGWCLRHWRRPPATAVLLWSTIMLGPTILAADAPHFLRAVGVLPAIIYLPALGLRWAGQALPLSAQARTAAATVILGLSLLLTVSDYRAYGRDPAVAYVFEQAATDLAQQINAESHESDVRLDERFWSSWPSISFLVSEAQGVALFDAADGTLPPAQMPAALYVWPYDNLDFLPGLLPGRALLTVDEGSLARGDHEETAYPLFVRYGILPDTAVNAQRQAAFDAELFLRQVDTEALSPTAVQVDVYWDAEPPVREDVTAFVHILGPDGLVGQDDAPLAAGRWPAAWWRPGLVLRDRHVVFLDEDHDPARQTIVIGLYDAQSGARLPVTDAQTGAALGDVWTLSDGK